MAYTGPLKTVFGFHIPSAARRAFKPLLKNNLIRVERELLPSMKLAMDNYMKDVVNEAVVDSPLARRTAKLAESLYSGTRVYGDRLDNIRGLYRGIWYARNLEYGKILRPSTAEVLTLPLPAALRPDGSPKLSGPKAWKRYNTFSYTSKKTGQGYLAYRNSSGKLVLLYMYVDRVNIKPSLGLRKKHQENLGRLMAVWGEIMIDTMLRLDLRDLLINPNGAIKPKHASRLKLLTPKLTAGRNLFRGR